MVDQKFGQIGLGCLPLKAMMTTIDYHNFKTSDEAKTDGIDSLFMRRGRALAEKNLAPGKDVGREPSLDCVKGYNFHMKEVFVENAASIKKIKRRGKRFSSKTSDSEQSMQHEINPFEPRLLYPRPSGGAITTSNTPQMKDEREGLCLFIQFRKDDILRTNNEVNLEACPKPDYYIHLFYNGSWCTSRLIPRSILLPGSHPFHTEVFHGLRIGTGLEKAWILGQHKRSLRIRKNEVQDAKLGQGSLGHWSNINAKLLETVEVSSGGFKALQILKKYVDFIAEIPSQQCSGYVPDASLAVIDVVVVSLSSIYNYLILI